jgi:hypothetical protein
VQQLLRYAEHPPDFAPREPDRAGHSYRFLVPVAGTCEVVARSGEFPPARAAEHVVDHGIGFVGFERLALLTFEFLQDAATDGQQLAVTVLPRVS